MTPKLLQLIKDCEHDNNNLKFEHCGDPKSHEVNNTMYDYCVENQVNIQNSIAYLMCGSLYSFIITWCYQSCLDYCKSIK